jgi:hypothetical protein
MPEAPPGQPPESPGPTGGKPPSRKARRKPGVRGRSLAREGPTEARNRRIPKAWLRTLEVIAQDSDEAATLQDARLAADPPEGGLPADHGLPVTVADLLRRMDFLAFKAVLLDHAFRLLRRGRKLTEVAARLNVHPGYLAQEARFFRVQLPAGVLDWDGGPWPPAGLPEPQVPRAAERQPPVEQAVLRDAVARHLID